MNLLDELEAMVSAAAYSASEIDQKDIRRWHTLFGFTESQACRELEKFRGDIGGSRWVSEEHWDLVKQEKEELGFDIEAYSYSLQIRQPAGSLQQKNLAPSNVSYTFKLEGPVSSAEKLQEIAGMTYLPKVYAAEGESSEASFCTIKAQHRTRLLEWLSMHNPSFEPTIVRLGKSPKQLSSQTLAPILGHETALPHQRPTDINFEPLPRQDQYPVWYFFYGRLLQPELLQRHLGLAELPLYRPARIRCARLQSWQGKYKAVIDGEEDDIVEGGAFLVEDEEQEDALRFFETDMYEVVRCRLQMLDTERGEIYGLVFRFCGLDSELT